MAATMQADREELVEYLQRVMDDEAWANTGEEAAEVIVGTLGWVAPSRAQRLEAVAEAARTFLAAWRRGEDETHALDEAQDLQDALDELSAVA